MAPTAHPTGMYEYVFIIPHYSHEVCLICDVMIFVSLAVVRRSEYKPGGGVVEQEGVEPRFAREQLPLHRLFVRVTRRARDQLLHLAAETANQQRGEVT